MSEKFSVREAAIKKTFGKTLREARRMQGISQYELGKKAKIHWTYIGGIEQGRRNPTLILIHRLARALDLSPAVLMFSMAKIKLWNRWKP